VKYSYLLVGLTALLLQGCATAPSANAPSANATMDKSADAAYMGDCRRVPKDKSGHRQRDLTTTNARCYSKADLDRTGGIDISDALRKLDPSIQ